MRVFIRGVGELCITAGLILLLFVAYELWGTGRYTAAKQHSLSSKLVQQWHAPPSLAPIQLGDGLAVIRIPKFGYYHYVIVQGVSIEDLREGPGHYPGTAMPGQIGNFVVSGHRTTYLAPFNRIGELRAGDQIIIDTRSARYIYTVTGHVVVDPSETDVADPVPMHPSTKPTQHLITLTTCNPKYSASQRLIVFGVLSSTQARTVEANE